jgi:hypothetical protein
MSEAEEEDVLLWAPDKPSVWRIEFDSALVLDTPQTFAFEYPLPKGRYQVRVVIETEEFISNE